MTATNREPNERGTTLTEVVVTLAIATIVALPILAMLRSATASETTMTDRLVTITDVRRAVDLIGDDVRAGTLDASGLAGTLDPATTLRLTQPSDGSVIEWRTGSGALRRQRSSAGTLLSDALVLDDEQVAFSLGEAVFVYRDAAGNALSTTDTAVVDACTATIEVRLHETPGDGEPLPSQPAIEATIRLRLAATGGTACP